MSIKVTSWVWENSKAKGSALLLLLAIADHAHDDGDNAYPSVETLTAKCRQSERNTQRLLRELEKAGEIVIKDQAGPHGCNVYQIPVPWGAILSGVQSGVRGVQSTVKIVPQMSPEPSLTAIEPVQQKTDSPKANVYAAYEKTYGDLLGDRSSKVIVAIETLEQFPQDYVDEALRRAKKRELQTNERWRAYSRLPYAIPLCEEWAYAGKILPERPPTPPKQSKPNQYRAPQASGTSWDNLKPYG